MRTLRNKRIRNKTIRNSDPLIRKITTDIIARNRLNGSSKKPIWRSMQVGGASISKEGFTFMYDKSDKNTYFCVARKPHRNLCFKIVFDTYSKEILVDISYNIGCASNKDLPKSSGTLIMLSAILELIFAHKDIQKYRAISLSDTSRISCISYIDDTATDIRLMDTYFLCTGCTWYSTLAPMFLARQRDEHRFLKNRASILSSFSWEDFLNKLPIEIKDEINTIIRFNDESRRELPAHEILNKIRTGKVHCIIFDTYMTEFLQAYGVESMNNKEWRIPLRNGKVVACNEDPVLSVCKNPSHDWIIPDSLMEWVSDAEYDTYKKSIQQQDSTYAMQYIVEKNITY